MATTLVHAADVHLETAFTEVRGGVRRRAALADAFVRIVDLAIERRADALTIGGDLYEAERAGPQTARFLFEQFARFGGPVLVAPGNHDPYSSRSLYARDDLPPNVHVFAEPTWSTHPLGDGITVYGFGHTPAEPGRPFAGARFERPGVRIALVHGSDEDRCPPGKRATAPFTLAEIRAAGAACALVGHYHNGAVVADAQGPALAYPGSPEPIKFGERGNHGALVVTVRDGTVSIEPVETARTRLGDLDVALADAASEHAVLGALEDALRPFGRDDYLRVRLHGTVAPGTRVDRELIADRFGGALGAIEVVDETVDADYAAIAREPNVRGRAVADLLARADGGDEDARAALRYALAAFDGAEPAP
ncbi:MAG TPA: metallophosphoesterase [Candidatus Limnocylindria bacterium]|jgi:DNA repair exonuclease SbcCD nuclease subunit|nr:metallophosphoesterase [Candidatus Limnocylindria bacterium]